MMNTPSVQATLDALLENRASSKTLRLAIAVALDTPVGELREVDPQSDRDSRFATKTDATVESNQTTAQSDWYQVVSSLL